MKNQLATFLLILFAFACNKPGPTKDPQIINISEWVKELMDEQKIPGVSITVAKNGNLVWSEGFGYADLEQKVKMQAGKTKLRVGSISKTLTASALAQLYENGQIDLDAEVRTYLPEFPQKKYPITIRQLAGHLAGIRHYNEGEFLIRDRYHSVSDGLEIFMDDTLLHVPGTKYRYSSHAWNLLSAVLEKVSGQQFLTLMQESVFDRIGMANTTADLIDSLVENRTRYYALNGDGRVVNAPYVDNSYKWAGGGFLSTPEDIVKFALAHRNGGGVLQDKTLEEFIASQKTTDGEPTNYGMGWRSGVDQFNRPWYGHTGGSVGGISVMRIYPEEDIVIVILSNSSDVQYGDLPDRIVDAFI